MRGGDFEGEGVLAVRAAEFGDGAVDVAELFAVFDDFFDGDVGADAFLCGGLFEAEFLFVFLELVKFLPVARERVGVFAVLVEQLVKLEGELFELLLVFLELFNFFFVRCLELFDARDFFVDGCELEFGFVFFSEECLLFFAECVDVFLLFFCFFVVFFELLVNVGFVGEVVLFFEGFNFGVKFFDGFGDG